MVKYKYEFGYIHMISTELLPSLNASKILIQGKTNTALWGNDKAITENVNRIVFTMFIKIQMNTESG